MQLMLCIKGTEHTNTVTGQVYEAIGQFICPHCGKVSDILEFAPPVTMFHSITCHGCKQPTFRRARFSNRHRFIPLNNPEADLTVEDVKTCTPSSMPSFTS